jgi:uncharacterized membrane protein YphA (DoxX/SURF4 family)
VNRLSGMHLPAPFAFAIMATLVQFICPIFIVFGLFTRFHAALLLGVLFGAVLQNLFSGRDPQLAILYTLIIVTLLFTGGGRCSLDALLLTRFGKANNETTPNE